MVHVYDEQEFEFDGVYYNIGDYKEICAKGIYLNDEYVSKDELNRRIHNGEVNEEAVKDEYYAYMERKEECVELMNSKARDIAIPCEITYDRHNRIWLALLTEEDITELKKTYDNISIVSITGGNGDVPISAHHGK